MVKIIIFKFIAGFGNRLCNLMNLFYLHTQFPDAELYIDWIENNHCGAGINEILSLEQLSFLKFNYQYVGGEVYASTSNISRTKWDDLQEWNHVDRIVSVAFYMYEFVSYDVARSIFTTLPFKGDIISLVDDKKTSCGVDRNIIHFRDGDLLKLLEENEGKCGINKTEIMNNIHSKIGLELFHCTDFVVNRSNNDVLNSIADLIYLSKFNKVKGYSPYSHFSSWIYLLSEDFIDDPILYPIFNYKRTTLIFTE